MSCSNFLEARARFLVKNIKSGRHYDSLVLVVSCHGLPGYIATSDYKKYCKVAIHRTFSYHAVLRTIPRIVLFDCCQGIDTRESVVDEQGKSGQTTVESTEQCKSVEEKDIFGGKFKNQKWTEIDDNPDHWLGRIDAANAGFQSKIDSKKGSLLIAKLYEKYKQKMEDEDAPFIHEIMDEIQHELEDEGKQLPECVWNTGTRYVVFQKKASDEKNGHLTNKVQLAKSIQLNIVPLDEEEGALELVTVGKLSN